MTTTWYWPSVKRRHAGGWAVGVDDQHGLVLVQLGHVQAVLRAQRVGLVQPVEHLADAAGDGDAVLAAAGSWPDW